MISLSAEVTSQVDNTDQVLVFDVGGSHVACSLFCPSSLAVGPIRRLPLRGGCSQAEFFETFESLATSVLTGPLSLSGVAIAMPNPFDYDRGISYMQHKFKPLYGIDLRQRLSERLACNPSRIHFLNDAAAFLLGEISNGMAAGVSRAIGITLGTGVGSAFAVDGEIVVDGHGVPPGGEIWNLPYHGSGIVEDLVSASAIQRIYEELTGSCAEVREIAALGADNDPARLTFESFGKELGKVLRHTCLAFAPERIVLGGGISRAARLFLRDAEMELVGSATQLRVSDMFEHAPLVGAGVSWMRKDRDKNSLPTREQIIIAE